MKKLIALLLSVLLLAALFTGCMGIKPLDPPGSEPAEKEPVSTGEAPSGTPADTQAPVPADADGAALLARAVELLNAAGSLRFHIEINETVSTEGFAITIDFDADGVHSSDPKAIYIKGKASVFGMEIPMEQYRFTEDDAVINYSWDDERQIFLRSEEALPEETAQAAAPTLDYAALETSTAREGGEYVVTVNATLEQAAVLLQQTASVLSDSEAEDVMPDLEDSEGAEALKDVRFPLVFRIDEASGHLTGIALDLDSLIAASMAAAPDDAEPQGEAHGKLELRYSDFDAVEPIVAPAEYEEDDSSDWDWDEDWDDDDWVDTLDDDWDWDDGETDADAETETAGS